MSRYMIESVPEKCKACRRCEIACIAAHHGLTFKEALKTRDELVARVHVVTGGSVQARVRILPDERLEIAVKDHGFGIADVAQARTPLYTTGGEERSGMGFTLMESYLATQRVKSVPGHGTTEMMCRRHPNQKGIAARQGSEY